jgi:hypothetical protein
MNRLRAFCPAKVNLGLNVLGRRSDGFHEIVTIFQAIDLCDVLEGEVADEVSLEVSDRSIPRARAISFSRPLGCSGGAWIARAGAGRASRSTRRFPSNPAWAVEARTRRVRSCS